MGQYYVDSVKDGKKTYYIIRSSDDSAIIIEPTKYLKHKLNQRRSPNTIRRLAYGISYYMNYMNEVGMTMQEVVKMKYAEQHEHFVNFLNWLQAGRHCNRTKTANNNTCNSYLRTVYGFYSFLSLEYDQMEELNVLEHKDVSYNNPVGVRFRKSIQVFSGYLPKQESVGKTIEEDKIRILLDRATSLRTKLMILLLAETGFRIGELLGVKYSTDIDFENRTLRVEFREDNSNKARAKNAEYRHSKVSDVAFNLLLTYISENRELLAKSEYLFITLCGKNKGKALTQNAVYSAFGVLERRTGIKVTPHQLRHYFADARRRDGWAIDKIAAALGHKHISTTEKYLHITDDEMADAMDKYFERNGNLLDIDKLL